VRHVTDGNNQEFDRAIEGRFMMTTVLAGGRVYFLLCIIRQNGQMGVLLWPGEELWPWTRMLAGRLLIPTSLASFSCPKLRSKI
jgi:hypothetical protein